MTNPLRLLAILAAVGLLAAFGWYGSDVVPVDGGSRSETSIGLQFSPWFVSTKERTEQVTGPRTPGTNENTTVRMHSSVHVEFLSWSWFLFAAAVLLLRLGCRRRQPAP